MEQGEGGRKDHENGGTMCITETSVLQYYYPGPTRPRPCLTFRSSPCSASLPGSSWMPSWADSAASSYLQHRVTDGSH